MQFSKRLDRFGEEIFAALNNRRMELEAQGMKIYNMSVGTPDFKTPEHIKKALAAAAMDDNNWKYSLRDLPELLEAVCTYYKKRFDVNLTPDMVMTVYGSRKVWDILEWHFAMREILFFFQIHVIRYLQQAV